MILIITSPNDITSNNVIDWLLYYNVPFLRICNDDLIEYSNVTITDSGNHIIIKIKEVEYNFCDFKAVWYRRSWVVPLTYNFAIKNNILNKEVNKQLYTETSTLNDFFICMLEQKSINSPKDIHLNKLNVLEKASKFGLKIPNTIITSNKDSLIDFKNQFDDIITKNYSQGVFVRYDNKILNGYTRVVTEEMINMLPSNFFPTLFQECLQKEFELRIFFVKNEFYSSAIFSQDDDLTKIDFRNYNRTKPNRTPPYILPIEIKEKLILLMSDLKLNSGSIDIIVDKMGNYIFLEVNPIGQFWQVSYPCNYYLEKIMAEKLINTTHGKNQ